MQIAEKTYADYKLVATNRGGHSSAPRPDNAIYALAGALKAVETHRFPPMINDATRVAYEQVAANDKGQYGELVRKWLSDPTDRETADLLEANDPGYTRTRCVATMLTGGHAPNALPKRAEANVNCRIFPGVKVESIRLQLQSLAGPDVTVSVGEASPESDASPVRDDVVAAYKAAAGDPLQGRAADPVHVGRRDRRLLPAQRRNPGLWLRRAVGHHVRTRGRPRP